MVCCLSMQVDPTEVPHQPPVLRRGTGGIYGGATKSWSQCNGREGVSSVLKQHCSHHWRVLCDLQGAVWAGSFICAAALQILPTPEQMVSMC
jgi:hypothetical protein